MRKILALTLVLGTAILVGGLADASGGHQPTDSAYATGVRYDWWGTEGELSLVGEPGMSFAAFDSLGNPIADGQLEAPHMSYAVGNSGPGPDGVVVFVVVGSEVVGVTDPDWSW